MTATEAHQSSWFRQILRWGHVAAWVVLVGVVISVGYNYEQLQQVVDDTHAGGCALQVDLQARAQNTLDFIKLHPDFHAFGITSATLRLQALNQLHTAQTLNRLHCGSEAP